ncbi:SHOCT domain-containing protein [Ralstonia solanacearum]|uniref:SHOCT domain-containing protein n=1 Tax=Ralstonia solanacearum TaxID=305 RepID=UPI00078C6B8A|nr:SHOCT domain-containing protein [Ralstonia solanacearum]AMP36997.1 hypothetical protein LBM2029_05325 [Ralstonia solanacearum]AXV85809.1 hypothetical protein CJO78_05550 [Ralstonia solanacearum]AXW05318.1 hypothetical protein CJO82_05325 [Ralstonia solanacearum]AXW80007.1 hypothetical protein CJO98_05565 [Ralstonia solanacearum]
MSTKGEVLYHPVNGSQEETWDGFSWPAFLFGVIWLAIKQLWVHFIISIIILVITAGFGGILIWFFYGFQGNAIHKKALLAKGYLTKAQYDDRQVAQRSSLSTAVPASTPAAARSHVADELVKLAGLRDSGILSEEEFTIQKSKLLGN